MSCKNLMRLEDTNYTSQGERMRDAMKGLIWGMAVMAVLYMLHYMVVCDPIWFFELGLGASILLIALIIAIATDDGKSKSPLLDTTDANRYFLNGWLAGYQVGQESMYGAIAGAAIIFVTVGSVVTIMFFALC